MRRILFVLATALLLGALAACGTKGDLVKPGDAAAKKSQKAESPQP